MYPLRIQNTALEDAPYRRSIVSSNICPPNEYSDNILYRETRD
jgi:hypothetical protein